MNDKLDRLFAAARAAKPDTARAEFGFETRLLARLRAEREQETWYAWAWRLMPVFGALVGALVVALGAWNYVGPGFGPADLRSAIVGPSHEAPLATYLTGE